MYGRDVLVLVSLYPLYRHLFSNIDEVGANAVY